MGASLPFPGGLDKPPSFESAILTRSVARQDGSVTEFRAVLDDVTSAGL